MKESEEKEKECYGTPTFTKEANPMEKEKNTIVPLGHEGHVHLKMNLLRGLVI